MTRPRARSAGRAGSSIAEALVAAALAGIALGALVRTARLATASLRLARDGSTAIALAQERLEALRAGPRADGADDPPLAPGARCSRVWSASGGRGRPARLAVDVAWEGHRVALATEAFP